MLCNVIREEKKQQEKLAGDLFGVDSADKFTTIDLNTEKDYVNFANMIHLKLSNAKTRNLQLSFVNQLLRKLEANFKSEDFQALQTQINVLINSKIKTEKGKVKTKKAKGKVIRSNSSE